MNEPNQIKSNHILSIYLSTIFLLYHNNSLSFRLNKTLLLLSNELEFARVQEKIQQDVNSSVDKLKRENLLRQQLKAIQEELGMARDDKQALLDEFKSRLTKLTVPERQLKVIQHEMDKLGNLHPDSPEYNTIREYLNWLTSLPWGVYTKENLDVNHAEKVLEEDHYGLKDVKERILEFIAVGKLKKGKRFFPQVNSIL